MGGRPLWMIFPEITLWLPRTMRCSDLAVIGVRGERDAVPATIASAINPSSAAFQVPLPRLYSAASPKVMVG